MTPRRSAQSWFPARHPPNPQPRRGRIAAVGFRVFYRLPHGTRIRLVRMASYKYIVGAVVLVRDAEAAEPGRLLLLRQPSNRGWTLPAGLLRKRESPVDGAVRELAEETGIRVAAQDLRPAVPNAVVHDRGWVDVVFELSLPASTTELSVDGAEVYEAVWHPLDALPPLTSATRRLLDIYRLGPDA
jgi:ADP-ribose pyrophosphatase YjhB (NUDIX family)